MGLARSEATVDETNYNVILFRRISIIYVESNIYNIVDINEIK